MGLVTRQNFDEYADASWAFSEAMTVDFRSVPSNVSPLPIEFQRYQRPHELFQPLCGEFYDTTVVAPIGLGYTKDGSIILDTAFMGSLDVMQKNKGHLVDLQASKAQSPVPLPATGVLSSVWASTFFHWFTETLPKLYALGVYSLYTGTTMTLLIPPKPHQFMLDSLERAMEVTFNISEMTLPSYKPKVLVVPQYQQVGGVRSPFLLKWLRMRMTQGVPTGNRHKLYISREYAVERKVVNEDEVMGYLAPLGFVKVHPEKMPFAEQVKLFAQADYVVAPHGSGTINAMWGENVGVIEFMSKRYVNPCNFGVLDPLGHTYGLCMCEAEGADYRVDLGSLTQVLEEVQHEKHKRLREQTPRGNSVHPRERTKPERH